MIALATEDSSMRFPVSQHTLVTTVENYLDRLAKKKHASKDMYIKSRLDDQLVGSINLARDVGVDCTCGFTRLADPPREMCWCKPMTKRERGSRR